MLHSLDEATVTLKHTISRPTSLAVPDLDSSATDSINVRICLHDIVEIRVSGVPDFLSLPETKGIDESGLTVSYTHDF